MTGLNRQFYYINRQLFSSWVQIDDDRRFKGRAVNTSRHPEHTTGPWPMSARADLRDEAPRVLDAARDRGIAAKAAGGLAIFLRCPSARRPPLARDYKDLDLAIPREGSPDLSSLLVDLGYEADAEFNALHGHKRLLFWDRQHERQVDVFVDRMELCHTLDLRGSFEAAETTLPLADLLLAKLQVVETNEKDFQDAAALFADHDLSADETESKRITTVLAEDWGWWRTATEALSELATYVERLDAFEAAPVVTKRVASLRRRIDDAPKSMRWRLRSRIGERLKWYELPEEVEG
jgi:hypothetical protein